MIDWSDWLAAFLDPRTTLEVTLFGYTTCSPHWRMQDRILPEEDLIYVLTDGAAVGEVDGQPVQFEEGSAFWMPRGIRHSFGSAAGIAPPTVYHLRFRHPLEARPFLRTQRSEAIREAARRAYGEVHLPGSDRDLRLRAQIALLLSAFTQGAAAAERAGPHLDAAQQRAVHQCVAGFDPEQRPQPGDLARAVGLTPAWFSRCFTATYGCSPRTWLKRHRLQRAAERIAESVEPIGTIAAAFGYDELFRFSRQFREVLGCSPRAWRHRHQPARRQR